MWRCKSFMLGTGRQHLKSSRFFLVQVLSAKAQVLLLEDMIVSNGLKSIPAQTHVQPGIQQDHVFDAGEPHPASTLNVSRMLQLWSCLTPGTEA